MTLAATQKELNEIFSLSKAICETAKIANRHGKSLSGNGFYAEKFHKESVRLHRLQKELCKRIEHAGLDENLTKEFTSAISIIRSTISSQAARIEHLRKLRSIGETQLLPALEWVTASPVPATEQVLPMDVVSNSRGYFEVCIRQANGCYEHQWFDACAVMIRKFVELLIIEVYDANGRSNEIKDGKNQYLMLRDLVVMMASDASWSLGRKTLVALPRLKDVGDLSAHARRYFARKHDIDQIHDDLRIVSDELLHLAKIR